MRFLEDQDISYRAKGLLACVLMGQEEVLMSEHEFTTAFHNPQLNSEFVFKFALDELAREGYAIRPAQKGVATKNQKITFRACR